MESMRDLYHDEIQSLRDFRIKLDAHKIDRHDIEQFTTEYEELVAQAKVITRVSDRLQKKLDDANTQIKDQNNEIKEKNLKLEETIQQLVKARVGRKASSIILFVAIILYVAEEYFFEEIIRSYVSSPFLNLFVLLFIALILKFLESGLEESFLKGEKRKIMKEKKKKVAGIK